MVERRFGSGLEWLPKCTMNWCALKAEVGVLSGAPMTSRGGRQQSGNQPLTDVRFALSSSPDRLPVTFPRGIAQNGKNLRTAAATHPRANPCEMHLME